MNDVEIQEELSKYFVKNIKDNQQVCINVDFDSSNVVLFRNKDEYLKNMTEFVKLTTLNYQDTEISVSELVNYALVKYSIRQMYRYIMFEMSENDENEELIMTEEKEKRLTEFTNIIYDRFTICDSDRRNTSVMTSKVDVMNTLFTG